MKRRVIVVEDHAPLLRMIAKCLQRAGYEVATAGSGAEAALLLAEFVPDVVVSDVMMPGMDGYALAAHIRSDPRTELVPVVFLTAKDRRADRIEGLRAGVDAYLVKPFEPDELVATIENILARVSRTHRRVARPFVRAANAAEGAISATASIAPPTTAAPAAAEPETSGFDSDLTETERRVARLVARSLTNKEIASELGISYRTVEMHISHILAKKQLANRVDIARYMISRGQSKDDES